MLKVVWENKQDDEDIQKKRVERIRLNSLHHKLSLSLLFFFDMIVEASENPETSGIFFPAFEDTDELHPVSLKEKQAGDHATKKYL